VSIAQGPPLLQVSVMRSGDTAVIRLDGELDCATAPKVDALLDQLLTGTSPPRRIVVDADRLAFIDVSGLNPFIRALQRMPDQSSLQLRNVAGQVARVIRLLDLGARLGLDR